MRDGPELGRKAELVIAKARSGEGDARQMNSTIIDLMKEIKDFKDLVERHKD